MSIARNTRRRTILQLIRSYSIRSQAELLDLLEEDGVAVNQGTLSRDLRDLGVVKGPQGYALPGAAPAATANGLRQAVRQWLIEALPVGSSFPNSVVARDDFDEVVERYYRRWDISIAEDNEISDRQQQGLASPFARPGRLSIMEPLVHTLGNWILDRVLD